MARDVDDVLADLWGAEEKIVLLEKKAATDAAALEKQRQDIDWLREKLRLTIGSANSMAIGARDQYEGSLAQAVEENERLVLTVQALWKTIREMDAEQGHPKPSRRLIDFAPDERQ